MQNIPDSGVTNSAQSRHGYACATLVRSFINNDEFEINPDEAGSLAQAVTVEFLKAPNILSIIVPSGCTLIVVGDLHGQFWNLKAIWTEKGYPSTNTWYLFNGDLVDRGPQSTEILLSIFAFKMLFPDSVFVNRGNHESHATNLTNGFRREVRLRYKMTTYEAFQESFRSLPLGAIIASSESDRKIFVAHGGIPLTGSKVLALADIQNINRLVEPTQDSVSALTQILWNDPSNKDGVNCSKRGLWGVQFGQDITAEFLKINGLNLVIRSHEEIVEGYRLDHGGSCITLFSALFEKTTFLCLSSHLAIDVEHILRPGEPGDEQYRYYGHGNDERNQAMGESS